MLKKNEDQNQKREREEEHQKKNWDINHLNISFDVKKKKEKKEEKRYFHILAMFCMFRFAYFQLIEK